MGDFGCCCTDVAGTNNGADGTLLLPVATAATARWLSYSARYMNAHTVSERRHQTAHHSNRTGALPL